MRIRLAGMALGFMVLGLLAGAAQAQAQAQAEKPADLADLQCMALYAILANEPDQQAAAGLGVFYHLGRLEGRTPGVDWLARMHAYADTVTVEQVAANGARCSAEMSRAADAMQRVGGALTGG